MVYRYKRSRTHKSFSLLEVLITVAILSTAIVFIFRAFTTALTASKFSQNITLACYLAEEKIWDLDERYKKGLELPVAYPAAYEETIQNKKFKWNYETSTIEGTGLEQLKFTTSWQENIREKEYPIEFLTYLLKQ